MENIDKQHDAVKKSLFAFVNTHISNADLSVVDEIVLNYVTAILEEVSEDPNFDVDGEYSATAATINCTVFHNRRMKAIGNSWLSNKLKIDIFSSTKASLRWWRLICRIFRRSRRPKCMNGSSIWRMKCPMWRRMMLKTTQTTCQSSK